MAVVFLSDSWDDATHVNGATGPVLRTFPLAEHIQDDCSASVVADLHGSSQGLLYAAYSLSFVYSEDFDLFGYNFDFLMNDGFAVKTVHSGWLIGFVSADSAYCSGFLRAAIPWSVCGPSSSFPSGAGHVDFVQPVDVDSSVYADWRSEKLLVCGGL